MRFGQLLPRAAVEAAKKPPKSPLSTLKPASGHPSDSNCHVNRLPQGLKQGGVTPGRQERLVRRLRQCQIGHFLICAQNHQYERQMKIDLIKTFREPPMFTSMSPPISRFTKQETAGGKRKSALQLESLVAGHVKENGVDNIVFNKQGNRLENSSFLQRISMAQ